MLPGNCLDCVFFDINSNLYEGICKRYPPTADGNYDASFPKVNSHNWCGEFFSKRVAQNA